MDPAVAQLPYESPLAPGEVRCEVSSVCVVISVGPRTAAQNLAAHQWEFLVLALLAGGALAVAGGTVALSRGFPTIPDLRTIFGISLVTAAAFGGLVWRNYHLRSKVVRLTVTPTHVGTSMDDDRGQEVWVVRGQVGWVDAVPMRYRVGQRHPWRVRVSLLGAPPLLVLSGCTRPVVERVVTELQAALMGIAVSAMADEPSAAAPALAAVPSGKPGFLKLPFAPIADERPVAANPEVRVVTVGPARVRVVVSRRLSRWLADVGRSSAVFLAVTLVGLSLAVGMGALVPVRPSNNPLPAVLAMLLMTAGLGALVPWIWSFRDLSSALYRIVPETFTLAGPMLEVPGRFPRGRRAAVERWRVREVTAGLGRAWLRRPEYALLIVLVGDYALYALRGRDRATVLAAAAALRELLGLQHTSTAAASSLPEPSFIDRRPSDR